MRNLSLNEFIIAFGRYKRIMCSAFPQRAEELEADVIALCDIRDVGVCGNPGILNECLSTCSLVLQSMRQN